MAIDVETLKSERTKLKAKLRDLEQEQRKLEAELKKFRQQELQTKRQIEALTTLIEVQDTNDEPGAGNEKPSDSPA